MSDNQHLTQKGARQGSFEPTPERPLSRPWRTILLHLEHGGEMRKMRKMRRGVQHRSPDPNPDHFHFRLVPSKTLPHWWTRPPRERMVKRTTVEAMVEADLFPAVVLRRRDDYVRPWKTGEPVPPYAGEPITADDFVDRELVRGLLARTDPNGYIMSEEQRKAITLRSQEFRERCRLRLERREQRRAQRAKEARQ